MVLVGDESVDRRILEALEELGHTVIMVDREAPGIDDGKVLEMARQYDAVLVTRDKDFGQLVVSQSQPCRGVVLLRLSGLRAAARVRTAVDAFVAHFPQLEGSFMVVRPGHVRIRALRPRLAQPEPDDP